MGWGHSSCQQSTHIAMEAGVKRLALFHHAPGRSDDDEDKLLEETRAIANGIDVIAAQEGMRVEV